MELENQNGYPHGQPARFWENHPLYVNDPTDLDPGNGETVQLNPNRQFWFIKRGYDEESAAALSDEDRTQVFTNIPLIVRAPGFRTFTTFDTEGWLRTTYLWLRGHTQQELGEARQAMGPGISRGIARFAKYIAGQRTIEQLINGELPELPVSAPETPPVEDPAEKILRTARRFLATTYSLETSEAMPDELVMLLVDQASTLNGETGPEVEQRSKRVELLRRWLAGETQADISRDTGTNSRTIQGSIARERARLAKIFPEPILKAFIERINRGETIPAELGRIALLSPEHEPNGNDLAGNINLNDSTLEVEVKIPNRTSRKIAPKTKPSQPKLKQQSSAMTSEEFWKTPIPLPKPSIKPGFKFRTNKQPEMPEVERVEERIVDGKVYKVTVFKSYARPAPIPDGQRPADTSSLG